MVLQKDSCNLSYWRNNFSEWRDVIQHALGAKHGSKQKATPIRDGDFFESLSFNESPQK